MSSSPGAGAALSGRSRAGETCFDPLCARCPRLAGLLEKMRATHPGYHNAPVPAFGSERAKLLIVGLAPGMHGANASGRPFTGDYAGILLYRTLFKLGLCARSVSRAADDGLELLGCRITNAVKCLPPGNKPTTAEVYMCGRYLAGELASVPAEGVVVALGGIAHRAVLRALALRLSSRSFAHGATHRLPGRRWLVDSYHCSRYNTQTGRLTERMFEEALTVARSLAFKER
jgi:uracil-DNA glycosylase family 4